MATQILGGLDIGTQTTTLVGGKLVDGKIQVLQAVSTPTYGVKKGIIRNIGEVAGTIQKAFTEMTQRYHIDIYEVVANFSAQEIQTNICKGERKFLSIKEMTEEDADDAEEAAYSSETSDSTDVLLQRFKQRFRVNGQSVENPVGMRGNQLEAAVLELTAPRTAVDSLHTAITQAGMHCISTIFSGCADASAVLDQQARSDGALVINFGAGTCDYLAISNRIVVAAGSLGIGGHHLTNDLAQAFKTNQDVAERMKIARGAAQIQPNLASERYSLQTTFDAERTVSVHAIQTVTTERINETLYLLRNLLLRKGVDPSSLHGGVWLTGGTAELPNITEQVSTILECACRIGVPINVTDLPENIQAKPHCYTTAVGLLNWRALDLAHEEHKPSFLARMRSFLRG